MLEAFELPFFQRGVAEVLLLSVPAGLLGTWIVLRRLAFFSHAVGTASFPGLVLADGLGFAAPLGALGAAAAFAAGTWALRRGRAGADAAVALVLVGCLAAGVILASDVFGSGANIETLLFGSLLLVDGGDLALAAAVGAATLLASATVGHHWLRAGFDPSQPDRRDRAFDAVLLALVALAAVAALTVVGALLVTAVFLVPALTASLLTERLRSMQLLSIGLVAAEGVFGLWLSVQTNAPPGATIACVAAAVFALAAAWRLLSGRVPRAAVPLAAGALALSLLAIGCGASAGGEDGRLRVLATTTELGDFARQVGGGAVEVDQVLQPNTDPHDYEPRPEDVLDAADADLVLASGEGLDAWVDEVVSDSGSDARVVDLGAGVPERLPGDEGEGADPHWWHDPRNATAAVAEIAAAMSAADPARRRLFARNADAYEARLRALDHAIGRCMAAVPRRERLLVTDHDAFGYFASRYAIEVVGTVIPSQSTQAQASAQDLSDLVETIERTGARAVFPESSVSSKVADAIAAEAGASAERSLYGDSLGPAGSSGATYVQMERANADAMVRGFTGGRRGCRAGS
ncbi:MAG TPA: zinc ABC transporter substrate-binding protein [Solirubrobacterales bacterium]